ncbi:MAG: hypothetical protein RR206_09115 [Bacteroidaceae bacterium]
MITSDIDGSFDYKLLIVFCFLIITIPILGLLLAILFYKKTTSQAFFVVYAFYFGYMVDAYADLGVHYNNFLQFVNNPIEKAWSLPFTDYLGEDPYHKIVKIVISQFSSSSRFFAGVCCSIYAFIVICFIKQYDFIFQRKMEKLHFLVFLLLLCVVEYYWYLGLRYWTGVFFFMTFYSKYILTNKKNFLLISCLAVLFHKMHFIIIMMLLLDIILTNRDKLRYVLVFLSFGLRQMSSFFVQKTYEIGFIQDIMGSKFNSYTNAVENIEDSKTEMLRNEGNIVYQTRSDLLFGFFLFIMFLLWRKNKQLTTSYHRFYTFILSSFIVVNLGYVNIVLYERIYKFFILCCFSYLFLLLNEKKNKWINKNMYVLTITSVITLYMFIIPIVQMRKYLFDISIWFSSFIIISPL